MRGQQVIIGLLILALTMSLAPAPPAAANPATTVRYPAAASHTTFSGLAFDTCTAPPLDTMRAWRESRYSAIGIYIGGPTRACSQRHLTPDWVRKVSAMRWRLIPIYTGKQAPCRNHAKKLLIDPSRATKQGRRSAKAAIGKAGKLGLLPGSAIYLDIESYPASNDRCRTAVLRYISGWTQELHRQGFLSAVYAAQYSGGRHLAMAYNSSAYARPDAIWIAHWNRKSSLSGWPGIPDQLWASRQRGKQYRGPHKEKHGGKELTIDSNRFRAPVATVAHRYRITGSGTVNARKRPTTKSRVVTTYRAGSTVRVVCQTRGGKVKGMRVWNRLSNGAYISNRRIDTPSANRFTTRLPRCAYPYQVTGTDQLNTRAGPGTSHQLTGSMHAGALARVECQKRGSTVFTTNVWNRLTNGNWVSDYYLSTPSPTGFSKPIRRC